MLTFLPTNTPCLRLYSRLNAALDRLLNALGLLSSPQTNENKILVVAPITAYMAGLIFHGITDEKIRECRRHPERSAPE